MDSTQKSFLKPTNLVTFSAHRDLGLEFETMDEIANELDVTYGDTNSSGTLVSVETFLDSLDVLLELGLVEVGSHVHKVYEALAEWEKLNKGMGYVVF